MPEMTTITALSKEQHCTYQAIWKLVTKYEKDLGQHVIKKGRDRYLDDYAVDFILEKRKDHPMVAINVDQAAIISGQEQEIKQLKDRIEALQNEIIQNEKRINELQRENQTALEAKIQNHFLLEDRDRLQKGYDQLQEKSEQLREKSEQLRDDLEAARTKAASEEARAETLQKQVEQQSEIVKFATEELQSYQRTIFGLYRKRKNNNSSLTN